MLPEMIPTRTQILAIASAKGGSGKTVLSASIAVFLGAMGKRVLLVDCDAATNGMTLLFLDEVVAAKTGPRLDGLFEFREGVKVDTIPIDDHVDFVPSAFRMSQTEEMEPEAFELALDGILKNAFGIYDFVVLDVQAGTDVFAGVAIRRADQTVLVSEYDPVSTEGVERMKQLFSNELRPQDTWVLFNKVLPEFATPLGDFLSVGRYLPPIPWDADVIRAFVRKELALDLVTGNAYTHAISDLTETLYRPSIAPQIREWKKNAEDAIRQPIEAQLQMLRSREETLREIMQGTIAGNYDGRWRRVWKGISTMPRAFAAVIVLLVASALPVSISLSGSSKNSSVVIAATASILIVLASFGLLQSRVGIEDDAVDRELAALQSELERVRAERRKYEVLSQPGLDVKDVSTFQDRGSQSR
jgi:MinD-like ATPase involved in chromosome partitioning or flagellar assembly